MRDCPESTGVAADIVALLSREGVLPERLRQMAWQRLLRLPGNSEAFESLVARGVHPSSAKLCGSYAAKGVAAMRLRALISALAHWCPRIAVLPYLPALVFPVTQVFQANHLSAFEFLLTFFMTWAYDWWSSFPGPPSGMLFRAVALLKHADHELHGHFQNLMPDTQDVDSHIGLVVFWPLFQTLLSGCLPYSQWLALWDFIVARSERPDFFIAVVVALLQERRSFLLEVKAPLLRTELRKSRECPSVVKLIKRAEALLTDSAHVSGWLNPSPNTYAIPLPKAISYPLLKFPCSKSMEALADLSSRVELLGRCENQAWDQKLQDARRSLSEAVAQLEDQRVRWAQELEEQHKRTLQEIARSSDKRSQTEEQMKALQMQCMDDLNKAAEAMSQQRLLSHDSTVSMVADELRIRRDQRSREVEQMLKSQNAMDLEEQAAHATKVGLRDQLRKVECEHVQKMVDMQSKESDLLGDLRMQQLDTFNRRAEAQAEIAKSVQRDTDNLREVATTRRKTEVDLHLQALLREFDLSKHVTESTVDYVKGMADAFEDDASRIQEKRQHLTEVSDAHALEKEAVGWKAHDKMRSRRWKAARHQDLQEQRLRRCKEEEAFLSSARMQARSRMWSDVAEDAEIAERDEAEFREALCGLDDIRRARAVEKRGLVWR